MSTADRLGELRRLLGNRRRQAARGLAHTWLDSPEYGLLGPLAAAVVAQIEGFSGLAASLFGDLPREFVLENAPSEWVACLASRDVSTSVSICGDAVERIRSPSSSKDSLIVMTLARQALELARPDIALRVCTSLLDSKLDNKQTAEVTNLRDAALACERRFRLVQNPNCGQHGLVAVVDWAAPGEFFHKGDVELLALVCGIARRVKLQHAGSNSLALDFGAFANSMHDEKKVSIGLDVLDPLAEYGDNWRQAAWVLVTSARVDEHFARAASTLINCPRCIVLSIEVVDLQAANASVVEWLKRCAPIGCRDWGTVMVLREFGVPAFFSGGIVASALSLPLAPLSSEGRASGGLAFSRVSQALRRSASVLKTDEEGAASGEQYTDSLAFGSIPRNFFPKGDVRHLFEGLLDITPSRLLDLQTRAQSRINALFGALHSCRPELEIPLAWRHACEPELRHSDEFCARFTRTGVSPRSVHELLVAVRGFGKPCIASMQPRIEVALAVDENLFSHLPVILESAISNCSAPLRIHVLARGITQTELHRLSAEFASLVELVIHDFTWVAYSGALRMLPHTTVSTMDRLLLPELLPDIQKIIYLDIDLVVLGDLARLWAVDLAGQRLAAKSSSSPGARYVLQMVNHAIASLPSQLAFDVRRRLFAEGPLCCRAFNAGVLVLNLARMRDESFAETHIPMIENWAMNDQDVLNVYARDQRVELDPRWNAIPRQDLTDGAWIVHFAGPVKPWSKLYISRARDFHAYASRYRERVATLDHS